MKKCKVSFTDIEFLTEDEASEFEAFQACNTYTLLDGADSDSQSDFIHFDEFMQYVSSESIYSSFADTGAHLLVDFGFIEIIGRGFNKAEARQSANAGKKLIRKHYNDFFKNL